MISTASKARFYTDWSEVASPGDLLDEVRGSVRAGRYVVLFARESGLAAALRETCRNAGISYLMEYGAPGAEGCDFLFMWRPGLDKEIFCHRDDVDAPVPTDVAAALGAGGSMSLSWDDFLDTYASESRELILPQSMLYRPT